MTTPLEAISERLSRMNLASPCEACMTINEFMQENPADKFAALAANAFIAQRIPVWFFNEEGPTPMVAFGVNYCFRVDLRGSPSP
jgi:hypothetical protein